MFGAIIGDIIGSRFTSEKIKTKDFELFTDDSHYTECTVMTLAVAKAVINIRNGSEPSSSKLLSDSVSSFLRVLGRMFPDAGYSHKYMEWLEDDNAEAFKSTGNEAAIRISPVGYAFCNSVDMTKYCKAVTVVTHNTPQAVKGAEAVCRCISLCLNQTNTASIRETISINYYPLDFSLADIRDQYKSDPSCNKTVPIAIEAFLESTGFEDAIRNAVSMGGDSSALASITGAIAGAYYPIPGALMRSALTYLPVQLLGLCEEWDRFTA